MVMMGLVMGLGAVLAVIGQAAFSLALGGTFMVIYGAYLDQSTRLLPLALLVGSVGGVLIGLITEWLDASGKIEKRSESSDLGGTMRLGAYPCILGENTRAMDEYGCREISERHRHRFELNPEYKDTLEEKGLLIWGTSPDGRLVEMVEHPDHPWFVGCQFHPEFKSKPMKPHPLFRDFISAALNKKLNG